MSQSRRKTPVTGLTTARSEKFDKRIMNRAIRRKTKVRIKTSDPEEYLDIKNDEVMNIWSMQKDGKQRLEKVNHPQCEKCISQLQCTVDEEYKSRCDLMVNYERYRRMMRK